MEIPFYCTFTEFQQNYKTDFEQWKHIFPDGSETDFIYEIRSLYGMFLDNSGREIDEEISSYWIHEEYPEYYQLSLSEYADIMKEKLKDFAKINDFLTFDDDFTFSLKDDIEILDFWEECNVRTKSNGAVINDQRHKYYREFFNSNGISISFDEIRYRNFKFSIWKIKDFLKDREMQSPYKTDGIPTKEIESLEPKTKSQFTTPEKIALLQITELERRIDILTGNVSEQKYRLLSALFGVSYDTVKKAYLNSTITPLHRKRAKDFYNNNFNE